MEVKPKVNNKSTKPINIYKNGDLLKECASIQEAGRVLKEDSKDTNFRFTQIENGYIYGRPWSYNGATYTFVTDEEVRNKRKGELEKQLGLQDKIDRAYPRYYDYDVNITIEQWIELLQDNEIFTEKNLEHMKCIYSFDNHAATCKEVSGKLGGTASTYVGLATTLAKRIATKLNIEKLPAKDGSGGDVYWYILFYGQKVHNNERGNFEWKLRPELAVALKELYPELEYPKPIIEKKLDNVPTSVWLSTAFLTYMSFKNVQNPNDTKIYHEIPEIQKVAKEICSKKIDYARVYQWCNGDHENHTYCYLREGKGALRRLSVPGEFGGEKEKPENLDLDLEFELDDVIVNVNTLIDFVEREYTELVKGTGRDGLNKFAGKNEFSLNTILYGPPGTGKTYNTVLYTVAICDQTSIESVKDLPYEEVLNRYKELKEEGKVAFTTFHQSYGYEEFIEGIKPTLTRQDNGSTSDLQYEYASGVFKKFCEKANNMELNIVPHVFIIDEINRGNISKVFGELITLIEPSKRIGELEASTAILPYTGDDFGVPNNVYILGTMNTADRSIALMDTALRRRFHFIEMMPDSNVLTKLGIGDVEGINVVAMLNVINERIEYLFDREHTIGHAYLASLAKDCSLKNLASIFLNTIIPLLQEYFYEDYSKIQLVLGDNGKSDDIYKFILDKEINIQSLFKGNPDIDLPDRKYIIQKAAFYQPESYIQIY